MLKTIFTPRAFFTFVTVLALAACGGGSGPQNTTGMLPFESLDGTPNVFNEGIHTVNLDNHVPVTNPARALDAQLFAVFRTGAELDRWRVGLAGAASHMYTPPSFTPPSVVLPLTDPNYFDTHDLLVVDVNKPEPWRLKLDHIRETADRIEVCFAITAAYGGGDAFINGYNAWFAISKRDKPVLILPLAVWQTINPPAPADFPADGCPGETK